MNGGAWGQPQAQEKARSVGGRLEQNSRPTENVAVHVSLPLARAVVRTRHRFRSIDVFVDWVGHFHMVFFCDSLVCGDLYW